MKPVRLFNSSTFNSELKPDSHFRQWIEKFKNTALIEVGCGNGFHSIQLAKKNPDRPIIAIERTINKFQAFQSRIESHKLENLYGVHGDATHWIPTNIGPNQIESYYFLYPNPYPKEKQANKRFHRSPFLHFVLETLKARGSIYFATNEKWFRDECIEYCTNIWNLKISKNIQISGTESTPITFFEKKYLQRGQTCYHLCFCKDQDFDSSTGL